MGRAGRERGAMTKKTFTRSKEFTRWLEIVGASGTDRRSSLPKDKPVYRI